MIKDDVLRGQLAKFPAELGTLKKFEPDFDVTWGHRSRRFNTEVSVYFLKPKAHISQAFGFDQELILAISDYPTLEARTIQAIEDVFQNLPAKGRVDQTACLLISADPAASTWIKEYTAQNPQARAYVCIPAHELPGMLDPWAIRNILVSQLYSRDLFDYTLPLDSDLFFFGRANIVAEHIDAIRRSENRGIFGLRKTGKTSLLFKIMRQCEENGIDAFYYDCKLPSIYRNNADALLDRISGDISEKIKGVGNKWKRHESATDRLMSLVKSIPEKSRFCLIFDEVEYISFMSNQATHWSSEYIVFWQTLWSVQSQYRRFGFVVAGVNASISEVDRVSGVQNPVFGILKSRYLTGFEKAELHSMTTVLGKRMGLRFDTTAVDALFERYGGHPLLSRMICSQINTALKVNGTNRPATITRADVIDDYQSREEEIQFYCNHITSELEEFYPQEYEMLEMLSIHNIVDFNELSSDIDLVRHLRAYGLIDLSQPFQPKLKIPVVEGFLASKWRQKNRQTSNWYVVPAPRRAAFVASRTASLLNEFRATEKKFAALSLPVLYGVGGPREAEKFAASSPASSRDEVVSFLNQANRSLVEPIDDVGKNLKNSKYFFETIKSAYPLLWDGLNRLRSYRNYFMHLELTALASAHLDEYVQRDFGGAMPESVQDGYFRVQSAVLDGLLMAMQAEYAKYD